jgi:hypothetical protein
MSFPWAAKEPSGQSSFDAELGPEGVGLGMQMLIYWRNLNEACQQLLGYSWRDVPLSQTLNGTVTFVAVGPPMSVTTGAAHGLSTGDQVTISGVVGATAANGTWIIAVTDGTHFDIQGTANSAYISGGTWTAQHGGGPSVLRRKLPWQHPFWRQLFVRKITKVQGIQQAGKQYFPFNLDGTPLTGVGAGNNNNYGPYTGYNFALLTLAFWRPPYYVRTDADIVDADGGGSQEWLRYVSKTWQSEGQMLSRESGAFTWAAGQSWAGIGPSAGGAPVPGSVGQVVCHEKISRRWFQLPEAAVFEIIPQYGTPDGLPQNLMITQTKTTNPVTGFIYVVGNPIKGCVNSPFGGGTSDEGVFGDDLRFFGCPMGTLRLDGVELIPQPLQLPPYLMQIPALSGNEALSQQQYDVVFHFDYFDPPRNPAIWALNGYRGHNLLPWAGDGLWYMMTSPANVGGGAAKTTVHNFADFHDLFRIL